MNRPLFCEGDAGVGKTALAHALAGALKAPLIRLQCYEGLDAAQALYDWDFARQILHIRAVEATAGDDLDAGALEESLFHERFLLERPILKVLAVVERGAVDR
jgi:MoxR-like ATPase